MNEVTVVANLSAVEGYRTKQKWRADTKALEWKACLKDVLAACENIINQF